MRPHHGPIDHLEVAADHPGVVSYAGNRNAPHEGSQRSGENHRARIHVERHGMLRRNRSMALAATAALAAAAALAAPSSATATNVNLEATCQMRDGRVAVVAVLTDSFWPTGSAITEAMARDGVTFYTAALHRPLAERVSDEGYSFPERREVIEFLPFPNATVRVSGHIAGFLPGSRDAYREATLDQVLACPEIMPTPAPTPGHEETPSPSTGP